MTKKTEKSKSTNKRKKNRKRLIIPVYFLTLILVIVCIYAFPSISGAMEETMTIQYGTLHNSYDVTCYIVRDEKVYYSPTDGSVAYHFAEGDGVRANTKVVTLDPSGAAADIDDYSVFNKNANSVEDMSAVLSGQGRRDQINAQLTAQLAEFAELDEEDGKSSEEAAEINRYLAEISKLSDTDGGSSGGGFEKSGLPDPSFGVNGSDTAKASGTLSYIMDGYEAALNPYTMGLLDKEKLESLDFKTYNADTGKTLKGEPLFKVVDRHKWYAVTWIEASALGSFSEGSTISIKLPKGEVSGNISKLYDCGDEIMVVLEFRNYYEDMASIRKVDTTLTVSDSDGLVVDSSYIVTEDGQPGVYVVGVTGKASFTPVKILGSDGENTLVASEYYYQQVEGETKQIATVSPYDEIKKVEQKDVKNDSGGDSESGSADDEK